MVELHNKNKIIIINKNEMVIPLCTGGRIAIIDTATLNINIEQRKNILSSHPPGYKRKHVPVSEGKHNNLL